MVWDTLRVVLPVAAAAYGIARQPYLRVFFGSVFGALGLCALVVVAVEHSTEMVPVALVGAAAVVVGIVLVRWGVD